jgi:hypothetical protein
MLGTAASSITTRVGRPGRIETEKSGAVIFQIELDDHILVDLSSFGGVILQALETLLHLRDAAFKAYGQRLIGER